MFYQQKLTPTTIADPTQAKIMQFMPLIFLIFFLNAPAGLVLYWLVNNVLSIVQQVWVNHTRALEDARVEAVSKG
jgi:YidC/Oxa1 family membrane protein insertase